MDPDTEKKAAYSAESQEIPLSQRKGKGKRGGNSAHSVVVHSGTVKRDGRPGSYGKSGRGENSNSYRERDSRHSDSYGSREDGSERGGPHSGNGRTYGERHSAAGRDSRDRGNRDNSRSDRSGSKSRYDRADSGSVRTYSMDKGGSHRSYDSRGDGSHRSYADGKSGPKSSYARGRGDSHRSYDRDRGDRRRPYDRDRRSNAYDIRPAAAEAVLGRPYDVVIGKTTEVGAFVDAPEELLKSYFGRKVAESGRVLLPFAEQVGRPSEGERVSVYFYEDKGGRIACSMRTPILKSGELGVLKVAAVTDIGIFLENNAPKQILVPFSEQIVTPSIGDEVLVWVYTDKSGRQAASMRVYSHLDRHSPYKEDDRVTGFVYEVNEKIGVFVAVDCRYFGLLPASETFTILEYGDRVEARVARVREDGKLDLLTRGKLYETVNEDADVILYELRRCNGFLPYGDRADASFIEETYAMSKNQFKRALGHLYKNRIVDIDREHDTVTLLKNPYSS